MNGHGYCEEGRYQGLVFFISDANCTSDRYTTTPRLRWQYTI